MDTNEFIQNCGTETAYFVFHTQKYSTMVAEIIKKEFSTVNNFFPLLSRNRTKGFTYLLEEGAKCNRELEALKEDFDEFFNAFDEQKDICKNLAKQLITSSAKSENVDVPFIINRTQSQITTYIPQLEDFTLILSSI